MADIRTEDELIADADSVLRPMLSRWKYKFSPVVRALRAGDDVQTIYNRIHVSKKVIEWLQAHQDQIRIRPERHYGRPKKTFSAEALTDPPLDSPSSQDPPPTASPEQEPESSIPSPPEDPPMAATSENATRESPPSDDSPRMDRPIGPDIPKKPIASATDGPYTTMDVYDNLFTILLEFGVKDSLARGIIRRFKHFPQDDFLQLRRLLRLAPIGEGQREAIVETYQAELSDDEEEPGTAKVAAKTLDERMERLKKVIAGGKPEPSPEESEIERLEREAKQVEIENMRADLETKRLAIQERNKALGVASAPAQEDDSIMVVLDYGGFPVQQRIRKSDMPFYSRWLPKEKDADAPPKWAQALMDRLATLEKGAQPPQQPSMDAQWRDELRRIEEKNQTTVEMLREQLTKERESRLADQAAEARQMAESAARRAEEATQRVTQMASPQYQAYVRRQEDDWARQLGYIPKAEVNELTEEAIHRKSLMESEATKNQAVATGIGILADKAKGTGEMKKGLVEAGAPKVLLQTAQRLLSTPEERSEVLLPPTPEQLGEFRRRVEAAEQSMNIGESGTAETP